MKQRLPELHILLSILVFVLLVPVLGAVNIYQYLDFKLNDRVDYNEWTAELGSKLETDIASSFFYKFQFVNLNGAVRNALNQREMNGVYKLNNGKLMSPVGRYDDETLKQNAKKTASLKAFLDETNTPLLFVALPYAVSKYDPQLPEGVSDYANDNMDRMLDYLHAEGIDVMDIREEMHSDGIDQYDMMYRTDHHWNTEAGFYTYGKLETKLCALMDCETDPRVRDRENYTVTTYPAWHLGSYGQRTGIYYGGIDDFTLFYPDFETMLWKVGTENAGPLREVFYQESVLSQRNYQSRYTYDVVLGGITVESQRYINQNAENDKRILLIGDSFYKALYPYLIMGFQDVQFLNYLDVPVYTTRDALRGALMMQNGVVVEGNYDAVVLLYEPAMISMGTAYAFLDGY